MSKPLSEQFRIVAKEFVELDLMASLLEESRSGMLADRMLKLGDMPVSRAEAIVKGSADWKEFNEEMCKTRHDANLKKFQLEYIRMKHSEQMSQEATSRAEMKL
jgi:hypothetical protein